MRDVRCVLCTFSHLVVLLLRFVVGGQMIWILWEYVDMDNFALRSNMYIYMQNARSVVGS